MQAAACVHFVLACYVVTVGILGPNVKVNFSEMLMSVGPLAYVLKFQAICIYFHLGLEYVFGGC